MPVRLDRQQELVASSLRTESNVAWPRMYARPLDLPQRVHQRGAIEVTVRLSALDDPASAPAFQPRAERRVLLAPHPSRSRSVATSRVG